MKKVLFALSFMVMVGLQVLAQTTNVTGTVTDASDGSPIPGVSVFVKGTTIGTVTTPDGTYTLSVPNDASAVVFSFVGMTTQEVAFTGQTTINANMQSDAKDIDEVIVVAYGTSTKGSFTGSAAVVDAEVIEKRQVANVAQALSGSVAGVQVLSDNGQPGASPKVRVRGVGSINAGMNPLYVVDGIPFDGDLSSISSSDIESMTVLKDAASTALYGARGANGIIMITTKKAKAGKANVNVNVKYGFNSRSVENYEVMTSPQNYLEKSYEAIYNAGIYNLGYTPTDAYLYANSRIMSDSEGGSGYQVYTLPDGEHLIGTNGKLNPNATLGYSDGTYYYTPDNWEDEMFKENPRQEYNLSISGGNDKSTYYISFNYLDDQGVVEGSGFERISGRFKGEHQVKEWLKVGANVNVNNITSRYPGEQTETSSSGNAFFIANYIAPIYPLYVRDAETQQIMMNNGRKVYDYGDGQSTNMDRSFMSIANPAGDLAYNKTDYKTDVVNSTWFAEISPIQGLKVNARYGLNVDNTRYNDLGNAYMGQSASYGGTVYQQNSRTYGFNQQYVANYQFDVNDDHLFDITAGYDGYEYEYEYAYASGQNLYDPDNYYVNNSIDQKRGGGKKDSYATMGFFVRANYSLRDTYFFNVAYRRDASSRFHKDNRWGDFYSASAAWMISNEPFMESLSWVNMLKLKASYGEQGNDALGNYYAWADQYKMSGADGVFADGTLDYKGRKDISWETSVSYNIGIDYALLNNRLSGTIEYFGRKSSDMLYYAPNTKIVGYSTTPMNIGSMTNSGFELEVAYNILNTNNINWSVNANATLIKNEINELSANLNGQLIDGSRIYQEGESMYRMFLVEYAGVNAETGLAEYYTTADDGSRVRTSDYSEAANHKIATDDLLPSVYGGFGTNVELFGFDASVQCAYQMGGEIYDSGYQRLMHSGTSGSAGQNWHKDIYNAWTPENTNTNVPRLNANDRYASSTSTRFLTSSDYLSLNNITVGYTLPADLVSRLKVQKLRIYVSAENVAVWAKRQGLDPRQSFTSATTARYTPIRTISGGLNLVF
ncbi:SusC/RagA family TonB-linked outer membrane protein [Carboxylicivirga sp. A043]|uniref:SusC/RagA family TonB-linked outer membrane protein n=1 Tax=Carboxylicivirga litoralis TaxID=2816963 RepID=UPI0021CB689D|nr:SusC/RagA family TonB-linked outer membrane protein [Carboxylicivirga sp. A043]MCU4157811.1 SusC/RagA family TonB-linked outer membrane protein [Carboxylicivirga sp. A043]